MTTCSIDRIDSNLCIRFFGAHNIVGSASESNCADFNNVFTFK